MDGYIEISKHIQIQVRLDGVMNRINKAEYTGLISPRTARLLKYGPNLEDCK